MNKEKLLITPKTKVYDLLKEYPELEDVLINMAPAFSKLKHPILRKTITKVTSLAQVAVIGKLKLEDLINKLRKEVGQSTFVTRTEQMPMMKTIIPDWFSDGNVTDTLDVRPMLDAGEHPVHEVIERLKSLEPEQILKIEAPFVPLPLIEKAQSLGYTHFVDQYREDLVLIYFCKE